MIHYYLLILYFMIYQLFFLIPSILLFMVKNLNAFLMHSYFLMFLNN